ncbi:hypothetical protein SUDANB105_00515 [Streptomyces sp. enrichment culture]
MYLVDAEAEQLRIVHTAGGLGGFALPEILPLSADSPLAEAVRSDRPVWRDSAALPSYREADRDPRTTPVALGVVPLGPLPPGTGGRVMGRFVVAKDPRDTRDAPAGSLGALAGFGPDQRLLLETYAEQLSSVMEIGAPWTATGRHRPGDLRRLRGEPGRARPSGRAFPCS